MTTTVLWAALCFAIPPLFTLIQRCATRLPLACPQFYSHWAGNGAAGIAGTLLGWYLPGTAAYAASSLLALVLWWYSRRKRKRSLRLAGNKAKARIAAMMRNMPRPSPRLVPQGARA